MPPHPGVQGSLPGASTCHRIQRACRAPGKETSPELLGRVLCPRDGAQLPVIWGRHSPRGRESHHAGGAAIAECKRSKGPPPTPAPPSRHSAPPASPTRVPQLHPKFARAAPRQPPKSATCRVPGTPPPQRKLSAPAFSPSSATFEPKLLLRRRARWRELDPGAWQVEVIKDLRDGVRVRDGRDPTTL